MNSVTRRGFFRLALGAAAAIPLAKKSYFFFGNIWRPTDPANWLASPLDLTSTGTLTLHEMHRALGKATIGANKPDYIVMSHEQHDWYWKKMKELYTYPWAVERKGIVGIAFQGIPVVEQ